MNPVMQDWMMYFVVAVASLRLVWRNFRQFLAAPLADLLLRRGKVKWAMRLNRLSYRMR